MSRDCRFREFINIVVSSMKCARFGSTYTKIGTIQRRLAWPLRKDDTQIREAFHIFNSFQERNVLSFQDELK